MVSSHTYCHCRFCFVHTPQMRLNSSFLPRYVDHTWHYDLEDYATRQCWSRAYPIRLQESIIRIFSVAQRQGCNPIMDFAHLTATLSRSYNYVCYLRREYVARRYHNMRRWKILINTRRETSRAAPTNTYFTTWPRKTTIANSCGFSSSLLPRVFTRAGSRRLSRRIPTQNGALVMLMLIKATRNCRSSR